MKTFTYLMIFVIVVFGISEILCMYMSDIIAYIAGFNIYGALIINHGYSSDRWTNSQVRLATEEEKQKFFDALEKEGKYLDPETKQIEDILKVGDLAIFWNKNKKEAIVSEILETNKSGVPYRSTYSWFNNAIKCTSLEQYINFKK